MANGRGALEGLVMNADLWRGRRVFLTGYTGFKGGWLSLWLQSLGARVYGYALDPPTAPNLFTVACVGQEMAGHTLGDVRDAGALAGAMRSAAPEVVIHMAAQPLVRTSYAEPVDTYEVNVMGTVNLLEAVRATPGVRAVVNVTTDKCYENREWLWPYREDEALGGFDPYSSSKACSEILTAAWRRSFLEGKGVAVATARAGNVIGGGDWAPDRLLPDILRAADRNEDLRVRSPEAVRPWQHVLEPLAGYLTLAERLLIDGSMYAEAWNFGPAEDDARPVRWIVERVSQAYPGISWDCENAPQPHEARTLKLDSSKARVRLGWKPLWRLDTALDQTLAWHAAWRRGDDMRAVSIAQIADYTSGVGTS